MIDCRTGLLIFLFPFAAAPALAQSSDSVAVSGEDVKMIQNTLEQLNESMDSVDARLSQAGVEAPTEGGAGSLANVLFVFLAIAVVVEAAMSAIFDWRVFIRYFEGEGVKTLVLVGTGLLVTFNYDLDILQQILTALDQPGTEQRIGKVITAFLISGGSSAVFQVYSNLGIRNPAERERKAKEERETMAEKEASGNDSDET